MVELIAVCWGWGRVANGGVDSDVLEMENGGVDSDVLLLGQRKRVLCKPYHYFTPSTIALPGK